MRISLFNHHGRRMLTAVITAVLFTCGCSKESAVQTSTEPVITETVQTAEPSHNTCSVDPAPFLNIKVQTEKSSAVYRRNDTGMVLSGYTEPGALFDTGEDAEDGYLPIRDSSAYLDACSVQKSDRWFQNKTSLIPYSRKILTAENYTIQDDKGKTLLHLERSMDTYTVYVLPSDSDPRYGIRFQNGLYYIPSSDVQSVQNTPEENPVSLASSLPVLMYHFFYSEADGQKGKDGNWLEVNEFEQQLQYLQEHQYAVLSMRETEYFMEGRAQIPEHSAAITIDDNDPSFQTYAYPLLKKYGMNACMFIVCGWAGTEMPYSLWEMRENGIELQSHSFLMHQGGCSGEGHGGRLLCTDYETGLEDTKRSFDYVDGGFVYCYPFGDVNEHAETIVRDAGAKLAFTTVYGKIDPSMDPLRLPRIRVRAGETIEQFAEALH